MARRNPMNERYGKHTAPAGKTRKSAASAKPKRAKGAPAVTKAKKAQPAASKKRQPIVHPTTPEYRRWRRVWWVLLVSPIVIMLLSFGALKQQTKFAYWLVGLSYALIISAILIDHFKLGKLRREWVEAGGEAGAAKALKEEEKAQKKAVEAETPAQRKTPQS